MALLENKRVIVTGGASGMGAAVVRAYVKEGAVVCSLDVKDDEGRAVVGSTHSANRCFYFHCDVSKRAAVEEVFSQAVDRMGGLDVLVHAAGIERGCPAESIPDHEWDLVLDINLKGTFLTNQTAFKYLKAHGGRILNFGSGAGINGMPGSGHYAASKGAVMSWTRTIAREWGKYGIAVNAIAPVIETPMAQAHFARMSAAAFEDFKAGLKQSIPLGGWFGDPDKDLAPVLVFLASEGARFLTGQTYAVDGGMVMMKA